jgi:hypothetical protein
MAGSIDFTKTQQIQPTDLMKINFKAIPKQICLQLTTPYVYLYGHEI